MDRSQTPDLTITLMNVGIVTNSFFPRLGGVEYASYFLAKSLAEHNQISVSVACSTMPEVPKDFSYSFPVFRHKSFSLLTPHLKKRNITQMIRECNLDLLHGMTLTGGGLLSYEVAHKYRLPCVVHSRGSDVQIVEEIGYGEILDDEKKRQAKEVICGVDAIIAVSSMNREMLLNLGADSEKVFVIHNGCYHSIIKNLSFENLKGRLGIRDDTFVLTSVGRNSPVKRMDLLFKALKILRKKNCDVVCICVGPLKNLKQLALDYGVESIVKAIGPVTFEQYSTNNILNHYMVNILKNSDLYVSCSYVESFNNSALDALACGTPVMVTPNQGILDVIQKGISGYVIEDESPEYLATMIEKLYHERSQIRAKSNDISATVAHLDWTSVASRFYEFYSTLIS